MKRLIESVKNIGKYCLLAGAIVVSGCSVYHPIKRFGKYDSYDSTYAEMGVRAGADIAKIDVGLSREKRTVPIHPDDGGSSRGSVIMDSDLHALRPSLGFECSVRRNDIGFKVGGDAKVYWLAGDQELQNLPPPYESYGYSDISSYTLTPFVGAELNKWISFEFGWPFNKGEYEEGHYRWDSREPIAKYQWKDFGKSARVRVGYFIFDIEDYDVEMDRVQSISFWRKF